MARFRKNTLTVKDRISKPDKLYVRKNQWVDPFPEVHGTLPEKMVYAELTRRNIPFLFLNDINFSIPDLEFQKTYQADFVLPDLKIILEVQGAFWHSKAPTIEADAFKFAVYQATGWKPIAWWDYDILSRLQELFFETPELLAASSFGFRYGKSAELPVQARSKVDTSKGIRTLNQKRFRAKLAGTSRRNLRKATGFYATN
jgi:hypothetical protein